MEWKPTPPPFQITIMAIHYLQILKKGSYWKTWCLHSESIRQKRKKLIHFLQGFINNNLILFICYLQTCLFSLKHIALFGLKFHLILLTFKNIFLYSFLFGPAYLSWLLCTQSFGSGTWPSGSKNWLIHIGFSGNWEFMPESSTAKELQALVQEKKPTSNVKVTKTGEY